MLEDPFVPPNWLWENLPEFLKNCINLHSWNIWRAERPLIFNPDNNIKKKGKEKINLYGKVYDVDYFTLKSKDMGLPKDKRLDFDIWYDRENARIIKVSYSRMGNWEYKLKNIE